MFWIQKNTINSLHATATEFSLDPLKILEKQSFSVFKGYRKRPVARTVLTPSLTAKQLQQFDNVNLSFF